MRFSEVEIKVLGLPQGLLNMIMALLDRSSHSGHDRCKIDFPDLGGNTEFLRFTDFHNAVCGKYDELGRYAADIKACAANRAPVHERHGFVVLQSIINKVGTTSGADNDYVIFFHD